MRRPHLESVLVSLLALVPATALSQEAVPPYSAAPVQPAVHASSAFQAPPAVQAPPVFQAPPLKASPWFPSELDRGAFGVRALVSPYATAGFQARDDDDDGGSDSDDEPTQRLGLGSTPGFAIYAEGMGKVFGGGFEVAMLFHDVASEFRVDPQYGSLHETVGVLCVWPYLRLRVPTGTFIEPRFTLRFGYGMVRGDYSIGGMYHGLALGAEAGVQIKILRDLGFTVDAQYLMMYGIHEEIDDLKGMVQALVLAFGLQYRF